MEHKRSIPAASKKWLLRGPLYESRLKKGVDLSVVNTIQEDLYPGDWLDITYFVRAKADWHCEHCGHAHDAGSKWALTVLQLNQVKSDCRYVNLVALCRKCRLYVQNTYQPKQLFLQEDFVPPWVERRGLNQPSSLT